MREENRRPIRKSNSGASEWGIIAGVSTFLVGLLLLAIDSSFFTTWAWASSGTYLPYGGIYLVLLFLFVGPIIAILA